MKKILMPCISIVIIVMAIIIFRILKENKKVDNNYNEMNNISAIETQSNTIENINIDSKEEKIMNEFIIEVNNKELVVKVEDNSSSKALLEKLKAGDITINAQDYGNFEKVGDLGFDLPRNDKQITTKPGDVILYQGNKITLYYDTNSWNFTKIGEVTNVDSNELKSILGKGNVTMTLKLK